MSSAERFVASLDQLVAARLARIAAQAASAEPAPAMTIAELLKTALKNEMEAAEEAALWLVSEHDAEVKLSLMRQCGDEAKHYRLIEKRLRELGVDLSGFDPLAGGYSPMFEHLRSLETTSERLAAGPFAREALAKVRNDVFADWCEANGDVETARLYREVIQPDEAHHHELGRRLLARLAVTEDDRRRAHDAAERTLALAEELQEIARMKKGVARAPGC